MTLQHQLRTWLIIALGIILFLWLFRGILLPFFMGMVLAYLLDPLADRLEGWKFSRLWATVTILVLALGVFFVALILLVPLIVGQLAGLVDRLPSYVQQLQDTAAAYLPELQARLGDERVAQIESSLSDMLRQSIGVLGGLTTGLAQSGVGILNALGLLVITPVVAFYLLLDWDRMIASIDALLPRAHRDEIREVFAQIDVAMAGFCRGQGMVVTVLAIYYAGSLTVIGLNFGVAIGMTAGLLSFIPYVGFLVGFVLSVGVAIVQFWPDWVMVSAVLGVFVVGQFLEGNVLYPKLVGNRIGVHAVWLMFALFAFAVLLGAIGLLLAVPLAAVTGVLVRFAVRKYLQSALYRGGAPAGPGQGGEGADGVEGAGAVLTDQSVASPAADEKK
jgi:predicted PurR-regulated permease PerM